MIFKILIERYIIFATLVNNLEQNTKNMNSVNYSSQQSSILTQPSLKNNNQTTMRTSYPINQEQGQHNQLYIQKAIEILVVNESNILSSHQENQEKLSSLNCVKSLQEDNLGDMKKSIRKNNPVFTTFGGNSEYSDGEDPKYIKQKPQLKRMDFFKKQQKNHRIQGKINQKQELLFLKAEQSQIKDTQLNNKNINAETQCYFQVNAKKLEKTLIKIMKNKINLGPISIDMGKVIKIKIFPAETHKCQKNFDVFSDKQALEINQYGNNKNFKSFVQCQKLQKENIIKISTVDNIFHFSQRFPKVILPQSKQGYTQSTIPTPEGPTSCLGSRLPLPFISFARVILKKLKHLYPSIKSTQWEAPQFPLRALIKQNSKILPTAFKKYNKKNYAFIHGKVYKKSQHKQKWQKRYIIINQNGLFSYKNENDEIYSFSIQSKSIKYMWTWFTILKVQKSKDKLNNDIYQKQQQNIAKAITDQIKKDMLPDQNETQKYILHQNQNAYLIIKIKHGFSNKTQFAIPICGFDNQINKNKNWLFAFYKMLSQYEY